MKRKLIFIIVGISCFSLLSILGVKYLNIRNINKNEMTIVNENKGNLKVDKEQINIVTNESNQEALKKSKEEKIIKTETSVDNQSNKKITTSTTATNTNSNRENKTITETSKQEQVTKEEQIPVNVETPKQEQVVQEEKTPVNVEQPKPTNSYVGVPNPNDFYYSFHKGHIDKNYTTLDGCYNRTAEVSLIDTVDVINTTCFEVVDGQGKVLGIYMYVKCNSGNCERYKTLVGIETN